MRRKQDKKDIKEQPHPTKQMIDLIIEEIFKSGAEKDKKEEVLQFNEERIAKEQLDNLRRG